MKHGDNRFRALRIVAVLSCVMGISIAEAAAQIIIPFSELDIATWHRRTTSDGTGAGGALNAIDPAKASSGSSPMTLVDPADPSTWTVSQAWQHDWQGANPAFSSLTNSTYTNLPWIVFDLGREAIPEKMWMWNVSEATGSDRGIKDFYLFYSSVPTVPVTWWAKSSALPSTATEYDFFSGGWTQFGGLHSMTKGGGAYAFQIDFAAAIPSCRYIGIAATTNWGGSGSWEKAGICTAVFTRVPPPAGTVVILK